MAGLLVYFKKQKIQEKIFSAFSLNPKNQHVLVYLQHASNPCIGSMLKINKNMLILWVKTKSRKYFFLYFLFFKIYQEPSHRIRLTKGPASAASANCKLVPLPLMPTNQ